MSKQTGWSTKTKVAVTAFAIVVALVLGQVRRSIDDDGTGVMLTIVLPTAVGLVAMVAFALRDIRSSAKDDSDSNKG